VGKKNFYFCCKRSTFVFSVQCWIDDDVRASEQRFINSAPFPVKPDPQKELDAASVNSTQQYKVNTQPRRQTKTLRQVYCLPRTSRSKVSEAFFTFDILFPPYLIIKWGKWSHTILLSKRILMWLSLAFRIRRSLSNICCKSYMVPGTMFL